MKSAVTHIDPTIVELFNACVRLSNELQEVFRTERLSLIQFKTESILETNFKKEQLVQELTAKQASLKALTAQQLDGLPAEVVFDAETLEQWNWLHATWKDSWSALYASCSDNQLFLKHSLRNLDRLSENLNRLFGILSTYTAKGTRVDTKPKGNVVEGKY